MKTKLTLLLFLFHGILTACDVPVFRYALERWERDLYKVFVLHRGELNASDQALVEELNKNTIGYGGNTNLICYPVDLDDAKKAKDLYDSHEELKDFEVGDKAEMVLLYPGSTRVFKAIWEGPLNKQNVDELLHSKATGELMKGVLQGYSATFLLMESGDKAKDDRAIAEVNKAMAELKKELEMPEGVVKTDGSVTGDKLTAYQAAAIDPSNVLRSGIPLKIDFHMVRMPQSKSDPIFRTILARTFKDESTIPEPKLFAFFGRGRLLGPMIGEEILVKNLKQLSFYLCGACSCQVKSQNPGIDFLTNLDWTSYLAGSEVVIDKELPPLIGMIDIVQPKAVLAKATPLTEKPAIEASPKSRLLRYSLLALGSLMMLVVVGTLMMRKK